MASTGKPNRSGGSGLPKAPTGVRGLDEMTGGGVPRGRPTLVCGGRVRQDDARHRVPRARRDAVRRARRLHDVRGERRGADRRTCARSASTSTSWSASKKLVLDHVHIERSEIEETGEYDLEGLFIRLGHAIDIDRRQARRPRHARGAVRRAAQRRDPARRAAPAVPLAQGPRRDRGHHRRARRGHADALRPRGVRRRLRDPARPPRQRAGLDAAAARRQVPRLRARHERIPVPDRRARASRCCRSRRCGSTTRPRRERVSTGIAGLDEMLGGKGVYRGQQRAGFRLAGHRQEQPRRARSPMPRAGAASARCTSPTRSRRASCCATCARSASTSSPGSKSGLLRDPRVASDAARAGEAPGR